MKKIILSISIISFSINLFAQNVNGVSTNPLNPINPVFLPWANKFLGSGITYDPFLNVFDWGPNVLGSPTVTDNIPFISSQFNIGGIGAVTKLNPFKSGMLGSGSSYMSSVAKPGVDVKDRDFRWQDGWELLWLNLGITPDLGPTDVAVSGSAFQTPTPPAPEQMPYFVLYNRYKGTMRIFANAFFNRTTFGNQQKVIPRLSFLKEDILNGMLRHANVYDQALDQKTKINNVSGPSFQTTNPGQWLMADFQIGFDPCICNRNNAFLKFEFNQITSMDISMVSRSISLTKSIDDNSYLDSSFMNLNDVLDKTKPYKAGTRIYGEMKGLLDGYKNSLAQYEKDLANYNSLDNVLKRGAIDILKTGIGSVGGMVGAGVAGSLFANKPLRDFVLKNKTRSSLYTDGLINLDTNDANAFANSVVGGSKSILAKGFDFLSTTIDLPNQPVRPSPPTATFTETSYKGTIDYINPVATDGLIVPGAIPFGYPDAVGKPTNPGVNRLNYPAYNEVLGLFALLETPKMEVKANNTKINLPINIAYWGNVLSKDPDTKKNMWPSFPIPIKRNFISRFEFKILEPFKYKFNHVLDFNFDKTKLFYSIRIKLKNKLPKAVSLPTDFDNFLLKGSPNSTYENNILLDEEFNNIESFGNIDDKTIILSTPFVEVENILNEIHYLNSRVIMDLEPLLLSRKHSGPREFNIQLTDLSQIESIDLKLMADMYFLSKGSKEQELNTLQTFTYNIYTNSGNDVQSPEESDNTIGNITFLNINKSLLKHQPGNVVFDNIQISPATIAAYTHHWVNATEMHIYVENAILKNNITVTPGYTAFIHFLGSAVSNPESTWQPELVLDNIKSVDLYNNPLIYEATDNQVSDFCKLENNKYHSNESLSKTSKIPINEKIVDKEKPTIQFNIYPNPANDIANILYQLNGAKAESISIYNLAGALVQKINLTESNNNQIMLNTQDLAAGIYFVTLNASNNYSETKKLIIAK